MEVYKIAILSALVFLAGIIDSISGGGGLISLSAYSFMGLPPIYALGTNKFGSTFGTAFALGEYVSKHDVLWRLAISSAVSSFLGSLIGARMAIIWSNYYFRYLLLLILPVTAIMLLKSKTIYRGKERCGIPAYAIAIAIGLAVGIYDGFFGPGTGMFLTLGFSAFLGLDILKACGNAKLVNFSSNVAALITYIIHGNIYYYIGIPCAIASILGNTIGANLATREGIKVVRPMVILVLFLLMANLISSFF